MFDEVRLFRRTRRHHQFRTLRKTPIALQTSCRHAGSEISVLEIFRAAANSFGAHETMVHVRSFTAFGTFVDCDRTCQIPLRIRQPSEKDKE